MGRRYSVVVIGLGVVGSASLWRLSCSKVDVLGVDSAAPINLFGSSHGGSRIFRRAYWEGTSYLPLLSQSDNLWQELDRSCSRRLVFPTGGAICRAGGLGSCSKKCRNRAAGGNQTHAFVCD